MPDDNRLSGIGQQLDDGESGGADDAQEANESSESNTSLSGSSEPGIPAEETEKTSVYGRQEAIDRYRAAVSQAKAQLVGEHGISDVQGKEVQDAALRVPDDHVDEIVDRVLEDRVE